MYWLKQNRIQIITLAILIALSFPAVFSLFHQGFYQSDDGEWMIIRFSAFNQAFRDGQFPVRFLTRLNQGYGYPVANFLYPGFMYFGEIFHFLGLGFVDTIKAIMIISMIGSVIFTFLWLSKIFGKIESVVGAVFFLYLPYHLYDVYKRGSVGEVFALLFVPFILWMIEKGDVLFISVGIFLLMIAHNTLALFFVPVLFIYSLFRKILPLKTIIVSFACGILMSSFFTIPAILELSYTIFSKTKISNIDNYFAPLPLVGSVSFIVLFSSIVLYIFSRYKLVKGQTYLKLFIFFSTLGIGSILFSSDESVIFWQYMPSSFIQFPFRLLSYLILSLSFLSCYIVSFFSGKKKLLIAMILFGVLLLNSVSYIKPALFFDKGESFYSTNEATTTVQNEYMPTWVKSVPLEHYKDKVELLNGSGIINNIIYNSRRIAFSSIGKDPLTVRINIIYYPGWVAYVDDKNVDISYKNDYGVMDVTIPQGNHNFTIFFSETPLRLFADMISIAALLILLVLVKKSYHVRTSKKQLLEDID